MAELNLESKCTGGVKEYPIGSNRNESKNRLIEATDLYGNSYSKGQWRSYRLDNIITSNTDEYKSVEVEWLAVEVYGISMLIEKPELGKIYQYTNNIGYRYNIKIDRDYPTHGYLNVGYMLDGTFTGASFNSYAFGVANYKS